jgi:AraC-like DNA-binding protein
MTAIPRLEEAQMLRPEIAKSKLLDIAESCGFTNQSQFSRVFRKVVGVTPMQYRRDTLWHSMSKLGSV